MAPTVLHALMSTKLFFRMFSSFPSFSLYSEGAINDSDFFFLTIWSDFIPIGCFAIFLRFGRSEVYTGIFE